MIVVYYNGQFCDLANGSHKRVQSLLDYLVSKSINITFYSFRNHPTNPWTDEHVKRFTARYPDVTLILENQTKTLKLVTRLKNFLVSMFPGHASTFLQISMPGATPKYDMVMDSHPGALLFVNYADGLTQLNGLHRRPYVVETHDAKFASYRKKSSASASDLRVLQKLRGEIAVLDGADAVVAIAPGEAHYFRMMTDRTTVLYVPTYVSAADQCPPAADIYAYDLLFTASDNVMNVRGFVAFMQNHPEIARRYRIALCGLICNDPSIVNICRPLANVTLLGFVDDLSDTYRSAKACISPTDGSGLKIKVIEALAQGKPVFGSQHTRDGLPPGYDGCVFPICDDAISALLGDDEKLSAASRAASTYYEVFRTSGDLGQLSELLSRFQ